MADVKAINVNNTAYNIKDATARTQAGRINLTKSGDNLVFTNKDGTQSTISLPANSGGALMFYLYTDSGGNRYMNIYSTHLTNGVPTVVSGRNINSDGSVKVGNITVSYSYVASAAREIINFSPACVRVF